MHSSTGGSPNTSRSGAIVFAAWTVGRSSQADEVVIRDFEWFEGVSDPDDMSIVYAIETLSGVRGTLADAFGVYSSPVVSAFMDGVAIRRSETRTPDH